MKAVVINRIVREETGIYDFTLVPIIHEKGNKNGNNGNGTKNKSKNNRANTNDFENTFETNGNNNYDGEENENTYNNDDNRNYNNDDDNNSRNYHNKNIRNHAYKPYFHDSNIHPTLMSFGHRPGSASRTFHPASMKIKLKHNEIIKIPSKNGKMGFGLPSTVLAKLLYAPKLRNLNDINTNSLDLTENSQNPLSSKNGFNDSYNQSSLGSSQIFEYPEHSSPERSSREHSSSSSTSTWNDSHHLLDRKLADKFTLRNSCINVKSNFTIKERLTR